MVKKAGKKRKSKDGVSMTWYEDQQREKVLFSLFISVTRLIPHVDSFFARANPRSRAALEILESTPTRGGFLEPVHEDLLPPTCFHRECKKHTTSQPLRSLQTSCFGCFSEIYSSISSGVKAFENAFYSSLHTWLVTTANPFPFLPWCCRG